MAWGKLVFKFFYYGGLALVYGVIVSCSGPECTFFIAKTWKGRICQRAYKKTADSAYYRDFYGCIVSGVVCRNISLLYAAADVQKN